MPKQCDSQNPKAQDPNFICNPATGRLVSKTGPIGKKLLQLQPPTNPPGGTGTTVPKPKLKLKLKKPSSGPQTLPLPSVTQLVPKSSSSALKNACQGKSKKQGGMNVDALYKLAQTNGYQESKKREDIIKFLCQGSVPNPKLFAPSSTSSPTAPAPLNMETKGFFLFPNVVDKNLETKIINIIETDTRFLRYIKNGKIHYNMSPKDYPREWIELLKIITGLHPSCKDFDHALQLKYQPGVSFRAHYDSKKRWEECIVGVNLNSEVELYFTKKDNNTVSVIVPPRSVYILTGESRYEWRHGIKKVKNLRYSITFRKKTDYEKKMEAQS